jgi:TolB protein
MRNKATFLCLLASVFLGWTGAPTNPASAADIVIIRPTDALGFPKPVPVNITGFTGEADRVLRNDLLFMGVINVSLDQAKYLITGSNAGRVEGRVVEKVTKAQKLAKAYAGGTERSQVHALADDIAKELTGLPGIAQSKITFKAESGGARSEVYIADFDGHNSLSVTRDGSTVFAPCWAGKGALVYGTYKLGNPYIFSHQLLTGARQGIARYSGNNYSPAVSPDGRRLAMILNKNGSPDLYVSSIDGTGLLTSTREAESSPCWAPDNQTICYVSRERGPAQMFKVSASGGTPVRIPTPGVPNATEPDWSPDGKWIAFTAQFREFQICIVRAINVSDPVVTLVAGEDPSWAPNSRALIFCGGPDHRKTLSLLDVPTQQVKSIARILESNSQPSWAK